MSSGNFSPQPECEAALRYMDSGARDLHSPDVDPAILNHIKACPDCSKEFAVRSRIAEGLKHAVDAQEASPYLEAKIRRALREPEHRHRWSAGWAWQIAAAAAAVILFVGVPVEYHLGHFRWTRGSQDSYIGAISGRVAGLMRVGLGDHVHCAVFQKIPKQLPKTEEMVEWLGPQYSSLLPLVRAKVPPEYKVITAHQCSYGGRKFVHFALTSDSNLLSVVITRRAAGESFEADRLAPAMVASGVPLFAGSVQRFSLAALESPDYLVYVISDLNEPGNLQILASLAEPIRALLPKSES